MFKAFFCLDALLQLKGICCFCSVYKQYNVIKCRIPIKNKVQKVQWNPESVA